MTYRDTLGGQCGVERLRTSTLCRLSRRYCCSLSLADQLDHVARLRACRERNGKASGKVMAKAVSRSAVWCWPRQVARDAGWWKATVTEVDNDVLVLRWRDWPDEPAFSRRRSELALLHPGRVA